MNKHFTYISHFLDVLTKHSKILFVLILLSTFSPTPAVSQEYLPNAAIGQLKPAPLINIKNAYRTFPGILTGGQPSSVQLHAAKQAGYKTIVNLRPAYEHRGQVEAASVKAAGMRYIHIPVAGAEGINFKNSERLREALANINNYPIMVHCASGNRVGALFALDAFQHNQLSTKQAISVGKKSGLTSLEAKVLKILTETK